MLNLGEKLVSAPGRTKEKSPFDVYPEFSTLLNKALITRESILLKANQLGERKYPTPGPCSFSV